MEKNKKLTHTKGNVIVENIKVGDIHYEYDYGCFIKCEVITLPVRSDQGQWTWKSKNLLPNSKGVIDYLVTEGLTHYSSNLYDYEAYSGCKQI